MIMLKTRTVVYTNGAFTQKIVNKIFSLFFLDFKIYSVYMLHRSVDDCSVQHCMQNYTLMLRNDVLPTQIKGYRLCTYIHVTSQEVNTPDEQLVQGGICRRCWK